jgi:predicted dehydrogenase
MTGLLTHWIDIVHWIMKSDEPSTAFMFGDNLICQEWEHPDTSQAAFRLPQLRSLIKMRSPFLWRGDYCV